MEKLEKVKLFWAVVMVITTLITIISSGWITVVGAIGVVFSSIMLAFVHIPIVEHQITLVNENSQLLSDEDVIRSFKFLSIIFIAVGAGLFLIGVEIYGGGILTLLISFVFILISMVFIIFGFYMRKESSLEELLIRFREEEKEDA